MDFNIEIRKKQLDNLDQLISSSRNRIQSVLSYLEWTSENVQKGDPLVQCPINPHHRICPKSWSEHIEKCMIKIQGYDLKSQFLSESLESPTQSIYIDHHKKIELVTKELSERVPLRLEKDYNFDEVITQLNIKNPCSLIYPFSLAWNGLDPDPKTSDRMISTYSPDERLIFYNHSVVNTVGPSTPPEFTTIHNKKQDKDKSLSYEEILSQQRDAKRRRTKYKSVHINRKNYTEVIGEVINGQMEEYKEWLLAQEQKPEHSNNGVEEEKKDDHERPHSSVSRNSNHSSSSRSTTRKNRERRENSRDPRHRSRSYDRKEKYEDRGKISNHRYSSEEKKGRNNHSSERERSRDRDRRYSSRNGRHGHDYMKKY